MKKILLTATTKKHRVLYMQAFDSGRYGSGETITCSIRGNATYKSIYKKVLDLTNQYRGGGFASQQIMIVIFYYWVVDYEIMIDNRREFGHDNQESEKWIGVVIPKTYVRGKMITLREALTMKYDEKFPKPVDYTLSNFISGRLKFDEENLNEEQLNTRFMIIPGVGKKETFFEECDTATRVEIFSEDQLVPLKERMIATN